VVDDTEDIRDIVCLALETEGYPVVPASDGQDAIEKLEQGLQPCMILLDIAMPRMDGIEFRRRQVADERFSDIPVVVCSSVYDAGFITHTLGTPVLRKPIDFDAMLEMLDKHRIRCSNES
jgi:CheY-like chemotaxis protein